VTAITIPPMSRIETVEHPDERVVCKVCGKRMLIHGARYDIPGRTDPIYQYDREWCPDGHEQPPPPDGPDSHA
jgi:hypothetical protein